MTEKCMKKILAILAISLAPLAGHAQFAIEGGLARLSVDDFNADFNATYITGIYTTSSGPNLKNSIEITLGRGNSSEQFNGSEIELEQYYGVTYRAAFGFSNGAYLFFSPSYARRELSFATPAGSDSDTSPWEFGFGGGAGYEVTDALSVEAQIDSISGFNLFSVGARYGF